MKLDLIDKAFAFVYTAMGCFVLTGAIFGAINIVGWLRGPCAWEGGVREYNATYAVCGNGKVFYEDKNGRYDWKASVEVKQ